MKDDIIMIIKIKKLRKPKIREISMFKNEPNKFEKALKKKQGVMRAKIKRSK